MSGFDKKNGFECEHCGARIGGEPYDFYQSLALLKAAGWTSRKDKEGNWFKFCCKAHADLWWFMEQSRVIPDKT